MNKSNILSYLWRNGKKYVHTMRVLDKSHIAIEYSGEEVPHNFGTKNIYFYRAAEITVDGRGYGGNVLIFDKLSQWSNFRTQEKTMADSVNIVVVAEVDTAPSIVCGSEIIITISIPNTILENFVIASASKGDICREYVANLDSYYSYQLLFNFTFDRLRSKCENINKTYKNINDWDITFQYYLFDIIDIAGRNRENFQELARRVGVDRISSRFSTQEEVEALLFGVAGMLFTDDNPCEYLEKLKSIYRTLREKYYIVEMNRTDWVFSNKGRNISLHIDIARLAALLFAKISFTKVLFDENNLKNIYKIMRREVTPFWRKHTYFSEHELTMERSCVMSDEKIDVLVINVIVPMSYAMSINNEGEVSDKVQNRVSDLLNNIKSENNKITRLWSSAGLKLRSALDSQAVIELQKNYCDKQNCPDCRIFSMMNR